MSKYIYLIRHGQDQCNANHVINGHFDSTLTELGRQQIAQINIPDPRPAIIYSSPLLRAKDSAEILRDRFPAKEKPNIRLDSNLKERDYGIYSNRLIIDIPYIANHRNDQLEWVQNKPYIIAGESIESYDELIFRLTPTWEKIIAEERDVYVVSHGDTIVMLLAIHYQLHWMDAIHAFHTPNGCFLKLKII